MILPNIRRHFFEMNEQSHHNSSFHLCKHTKMTSEIDETFGGVFSAGTPKRLPPLPPTVVTPELVEGLFHGDLAFIAGKRNGLLPGGASVPGMPAWPHVYFGSWDRLGNVALSDFARSWQHNLPALASVTAEQLEQVANLVLAIAAPLKDLVALFGSVRKDQDMQGYQPEAIAKLVLPFSPLSSISKAEISAAGFGAILPLRPEPALAPSAEALQAWLQPWVQQTLIALTHVQFAWFPFWEDANDFAFLFHTGMCEFLELYTNDHVESEYVFEADSVLGKLLVSAFDNILWHVLHHALERTEWEDVLLLMVDTLAMVLCVSSTDTGAVRTLLGSALTSALVATDGVGSRMAVGRLVNRLVVQLKLPIFEVPAAARLLTSYPLALGYTMSAVLPALDNPEVIGATAEGLLLSGQAAPWLLALLTVVCPALCADDGMLWEDDSDSDSDSDSDGDDAQPPPLNLGVFGAEMLCNRALDLAEGCNPGALLGTCISVMSSLCAKTPGGIGTLVPDVGTKTVSQLWLCFVRFLHHKDLFADYAHDVHEDLEKAWKAVAAAAAAAASAAAASAAAAL
jgi:hypothetical protein